jgi:hypothetical protein
MSANDLLASWADTPTRAAIEGFVAAATDHADPSYVPPEQRVAVFDNDGTLWCEKPMPVELGFILARFAAMASADLALRDRQPWKAATEGDHAWLERVIGSSVGLQYVDGDDGGTVTYQAQMDVFDDGPAKPVRIWSRIGRRPVMAGGNSNGDLPMLRYAGSPGRSGLRLLVLHDDAEREFAYTAGAEAALDHARGHDWTVVSIKDDWTTVFVDL